jgi:hypothetical protein
MLAFVQGNCQGRVPFVQYQDIVAKDDEVWSVIGRQNIGTLLWTYVFRQDSPNCRWEEIPFELEGGKAMRIVLHTPKGSISAVSKMQAELGSWAIAEHYIKTPADYEILLAFLRDSRIVEDHSDYDRAVKVLGSDGLPHTIVRITPFQQLWTKWVRLEDLCVHMVDCPDIVQACMGEIVRMLRDTFAITAASDAPYAVIPDNITAPVIGPGYFRRHCLPYYQELSAMMGDRPVFVHMDGDLKPLWGLIGESGIRGIDSFSPPPDNDTSVEAALALWPQMRLGMNFPSSVHLQSEEKIYETAMEILHQGGASGRLQIQISENVPPGLWRKSYPVIVKAIDDYSGQRE